MTASGTRTINEGHNNKNWEGIKKLVEGTEVYLNNTFHQPVNAYLGLPVQHSKETVFHLRIFSEFASTKLY